MVQFKVDAIYQVSMSVAITSMTGGKMVRETGKPLRITDETTVGTVVDLMADALIEALGKYGEGEVEIYAKGRV
jgi:hypothetical protein